MKYRQLNFGGGLNMFDPDHLLADNEYPLAFNIRVRDNVPTGIRSPVADSTAPSGLKQGLFGFSKYLFLVNNGIIYYKDTSLSSDTWHLVLGVSLSATVDRIYCQQIPATPSFYGRKLQEANIINGTGSESRVDMDSTLVIAGNQAGLIFQDGTSRPIYLWIDSTLGVQARIVQDYSLWSSSGDREYVPTGFQMAYVNGKLFTVSPDLVTLYQSVSGRPLDFVVNITQDGSKGGDASTVAYAASSLEVTGLFGLPTGQMLVTTLDGCYPIDFDYTNTVFAEPTYRNKNRFNVGLINQFSALDVLEDVLFIDQDGIRSYYGVISDDNEGRNSIFSKKLGTLLDNILQDTRYCCAYLFNNYAYFALRTRYGYNVVVYDTIKKIWVSIDSYNIGAIKQFGSTKTQFDPTLYCITESTVYTMEAGAYLPSTIYTRAISPEDAAMEIKLNDAYAIFDESPSDDTVVVTEYSNNIRGAVTSIPITSSFGGISYPVQYAVGFDSEDSLKHLRFNFQGRSRLGFKSSAIVQWSNGAKLIHWQPQYETDATGVSLKQRASILNTM